MKPNKDTIARTACLVLALVNQTLAIMGKGYIDITEDQVYQLTTLIFTICAAFRSFWKNNSFTHEARLADEYMHELKARREEVGGENEHDSEEAHTNADPEEV